MQMNVWWPALERDEGAREEEKRGGLEKRGGKKTYRRAERSGERGRRGREGGGEWERRRRGGGRGEGEEGSGRGGGGEGEGEREKGRGGGGEREGRCGRVKCQILGGGFFANSLRVVH